MMKVLQLTTLSALALSACAHIEPSNTTPLFPVAQAYDAQYRPDGTVAANQIDWQTYFNDPRLKALIKASLENNRDLWAATARIEQARARFRIQDSRRLPTLSGNGGAVRSRVPTPTGTSAHSTFNTFDIGVGVTSFELDFWGRIQNLSDAARAEYLATISAQQTFYLSLIGNVASTYFDLIETQEQIALAENTTKTRQEGLRLARLRLDAGTTSALDFHQAEALLTQAEEALSSQQLSAANIRNVLTVLVGGQIPTDLPEGLPQGGQISAARLDVGLPSDLLLQRPDIIAAEQRLTGAKANIAAARAAFFPSITLTGSAGLTSGELGDLFSDDSLTWRFGPSINLPIFDWGAREADLGLAKAVEMESVATYDKTVQTAFREVSDALAGRRWLSELVGARMRAVEAQEQISYLADLRYNEGTADYLEILDAERNLFITQQSLLEARRREDQNAVALFIALGGGLNLSDAPQSETPPRN